MKYKIALFICLVTFGLSAFAQQAPQKEKMTREEKTEKNQAREARINTKNDYAIFRRQVSALKEFADERKKIPKLQADSKMPVKVVVAIDSVDEGDTTKFLTGYIVQNVGDNAMLVYDITFDRTQKKITTIKKTQEAIDAEKAEKEEREEKAAEKRENAAEKKENAAEKKPVAKPVPHKKTGDEDDDDEPEDKPTKKDKDDD